MPREIVSLISREYGHPVYTVNASFTLGLAETSYTIISITSDYNHMYKITLSKLNHKKRTFHVGCEKYSPVYKEVVK